MYSHFIAPIWCGNIVYGVRKQTGVFCEYRRFKNVYKSFPTTTYAQNFYLSPKLCSYYTHSFPHTFYYARPQIQHSILHSVHTYLLLIRLIIKRI